MKQSWQGGYSPKIQGKVREIYEKLSKSGKNEKVLQMSQKILILCIFFLYFVKG